MCDACVSASQLPSPAVIMFPVTSWNGPTHMLHRHLSFPVLVFNYVPEEHTQLRVFDEQLLLDTVGFKIAEFQRTQVKATGP